VVTRADAVGGATIHVLEMAQAMLQRGHEAAIFVGGVGEAGAKLAESGAPVHSLRFLRRAIHPAADLRALAELTAALRDYRPDLVSAHTAKAGWIGRAACVRLSIPAIYTPHGLPVGGRMPGPKSALFGTAERVAARWAGAIVCVSESERRLALARSLAPPHKLVVVHNGVRAIPGSLLAEPAVHPPRIVSVARFEPPKDHPTLLRALARLRGLEWDLDLIGGGPEEPACRALAERLGIAGRVHFLGYQADVAPALARAQIFALSSRSEGFSRSVLEAMRAGLPVVAANVGGLPEAIDPAKSGLLVPPGDAPALSAALGELISDMQLRVRLGAAARQTLESRFPLERMIERTTALYETLLRPSALRP
jgi:glycosyltransferase involved in cell wall biosynthesis